MSYSILCLNCDRFVIELLGIDFKINQEEYNHKVVIDFAHHDLCKTEELEEKLSRFEREKLEAVFCRFPLESYIGGILKGRYQSDPRSRVSILQDSSQINNEQLENYTERLSFQYLDTRIIISNSKYKAQFENATAPRKEPSKFENQLIFGTAIAYRTAWNYHKGRNGTNAIWTF